MRALAIRRGAEPRDAAAATTPAGWPSVAALVFLLGRDADARLRELAADRAQARPVLGVLAAADESAGEEPKEVRIAVRVACSPRVAIKWAAALELARRMAGENLSAAECAEAIAAECTSAVVGVDAPDARQRRPALPARRAEQTTESGLRAQVWPQLRWKARPSRQSDRLASMVCGLEDTSPRELDRRLRAAIAFLQQVDFEIGRILRQVVERKLYRELGFERYVQERLDLSPHTARRLVRLARAEHRVPAVASAFRLRDASFRGNGLQPEFRDGDWQRIREAAYEGRGG